MVNTKPNSVLMSKQTRTSSGARSLFLAAMFLCSACASIPYDNQTRRLVRVENRTLSRIRAYAAFDSSPEVRVLLGTLEPNSSEYFSLPNAFKGNHGLVFTCERGRPDGLGHGYESFRTSSVALPDASTLVIRIREPIHYSDFTIHSED
jgi:hypothetical protein